MTISSNGASRPRVLVLARAFPNTALPRQGLWVARLVRAALTIASPIVISPVALAPPGISIPEWQRLRRVPRRAIHDSVDVLYPRVPAGLVQFTHSFDARLALPAIRRLALRLHAEQRFDLIHAHFIYPDGVIAAKIGRVLGVPVVTTEHANWTPWLDDEPGIRAQVLEALAGIRIVTAVSETTRQSILEVAGLAQRIELLPNVLDDAFVPPTREPRVSGRILFVGLVRHVKGLDVLVRALAMLRTAEPKAHLRVIGWTLTRGNRRDEEDVRRLAEALGVHDRIAFVGHLDPREVSAEMRQAAVLAVPSRRESFSSVTIEALASGTPVVATCCGGPEELLDDSVGRLVPVDDPAAMAAALADVLRFSALFDPLALRARVLPRYGFAATTKRLDQLYQSALAANH